MPTTLTPVPGWVSILFVLSFPMFVVLMASVAWRAAERARFTNQKRRLIGWGVGGGYAVFLGYTLVLAGRGTLSGLTIPPPIFWYTTLPLLVLLLIITVGSGLYRTLLKNATLAELIGIHRFRFVGVFFLLNAWYGTLPLRFALLAGLGDLLSAVGAVWVARLAEQKRPGYWRAVWLWNGFGLLDILSVVLSALLTARAAGMGDAEAQRLAFMASIPFCWLPAVAPPTILFLHIGIFLKLRMLRAEQAAGTLTTPVSAPLDR